MIRVVRRVLGLSASLVLAGCHGAPPPPNPEYSARPVVEVGRFEVRQGDAVLGNVVHLEIQDPSGPLRFYRIEDRRGAWVGFASEFGRFSKRVPFRDDDEDLGLWPMKKGVAKLFEVDGAVELKEIPVAVPAVARRRQ